MGFNIGRAAKGIVTGGASELFDGGGGGGPNARPRFRGKSTQDILDAIAIGDAGGIGDTDYLKKILARRGLTYEGANPEDIDASFDMNDPSDSDYYNVSGILNKSAKGGRPSIALEKWNAYKADILQKKMEDYYNTNVQPSFDKTRATLDELLSNPSFSAEELAATRSEMTSQVRAQESNRLRRTAAVLGLRGMDPGSVAGAALIQAQAEETDRALTEALRRYGLDVVGMERDAQARELGLNTDLTNSMFSSKSALEEGNYDRLAGINSNIGSILEAANTLDSTTKAAKDAARLGFYGNIASGVAQGAGAALGG